jgi:hypothetical protein
METNRKRTADENFAAGGLIQPRHIKLQKNKGKC